MQYEFTKMHGLGNDFVVFDATLRPPPLSADKIRFIADRHLGIGCDQVLIIGPAPRPEVDFAYSIFNADGTEVEQCGNGVRCVARFLLDNKLSNKQQIRVSTRSGNLTLHLESDDQVTVNMGVPILDPEKIPFQAKTQSSSYNLQVLGNEITLSAVSMGNPHAVLEVADCATAPVLSLGPAIEGHARFPKRVNVGFMQILSQAHIRLRVYERGTGETQACGSGACAAVVAGRLNHKLGERVRVDLPGGSLQIRWAGEGHPVFMTGPATTVYKGHIDL